MSEQGVTYTQIDVDCGGWECSGCKGIWSLSDGTPKENDMSFCPFCGKPIVGVKAWADPEDDQLSRTITAFDEDGNECEYLFVDSFELGGKTYAVLVRNLTCTEDEYDPFLMRIELDANNEEWFAELDDDERAAAEAEWARLCEEEEGLV